MTERPRSIDALSRLPTLRPFAPMVLAAWQDGYLTPSDLLFIRAELERCVWLDAEARETLHSWLDPEAPPSPKQLRRLERSVTEQERALPKAPRRSVSELGSAIAANELGAQAPVDIGSALRHVEPLLSYHRLPHAHAAATNFTANEPSTLEVVKLRAALDGSLRETRDQLRAILSDPQFRPVHGLSTAAYREQVLAWCRTLAERGVGAQAYAGVGETGGDIGAFMASFETLAVFDLSLFVKFGVQFGLFGGAIANLGTSSHHALLPAVSRCELIGCFAMTERGHGSNVRDLQTLARYDAETQEFVISTPTLSAGKEWIGNAALHASMAVVFAQLETQGEGYGVHAFLVPIRDAQGALMPSVRIEDCGDKMGLNGVDNGRLWFSDVRVPREALLDRFGQVDEQGEYTSLIPSADKRFFTMLGTLVGGRVGVAGGALSASKVGLHIALSYGARRRQFPNAQGSEQPLLDYLSHQLRLLPHLAGAYALSFAQNELVRLYASAGQDGAKSRHVESLAAGLKAVGTWQAIDTLQQCRECCGGQGYLTSNRVDALRTDTDVFTTFEGDNTVLMQLVAKDLLSQYARALRDNPLKTLGRALATDLLGAIVERNPVATRRKDSETLLASDFHEQALAFRARSLLESLARRIKRRVDDGMDSQEAFERCQDHAIALSHAHIEHFVLTCFQKAADHEPALTPLCQLYGLWRIHADLAWFLENDYIAKSKSRAIRKQLNVCVAELSRSALSLVEAFGVPATCLGPLADPRYLTSSGLSAPAGE